MTVATLTIEPDEFLGLSALAELDRAAGSSDDGSGPDALIEAKTLMRQALADKLQDAGLPWAPSADAVRHRAAQVRTAPAPDGGRDDDGADHHASPAVEGAPLAALISEGNHDYPGRRVDRYGDWRLRPELEVDRLSPERPSVGLDQPPACTAAVPDRPAPSLAQMDLGQC